MVSNLSIKIQLPCVVEVLWTKQFFLITSHIKNKATSRNLDSWKWWMALPSTLS